MKLVCINCPLGCNLDVTKNGDTIIVKGNTCSRGENYAINEMTNPKRMLTTTIEIDGADISRLPVISSSPIEKDKIFDVINVLKYTKVQAPIDINQIIVKNVLDTGVDIIASRSLKKVF